MEYNRDGYCREEEASQATSGNRVMKRVIIPVLCLVLIVVGYFGWSFYRKYDASMTISRTLAEVQKIADSHEYDAAIARTDELIKRYGVMGEKLIGPAKELRSRLEKKQTAWNEQRRKEKKTVALEQERKLRLERCVSEALRICNDPKSLADAERLIAEAEEISRSDAEKIKVAKACRQVDVARYKLCPRLVVADFKVAWPLNNKLSGSAVATKLRQALKGKFTFIPRLAAIKNLTELNYEFNDLDDSGKLVEFGKKADVDYVLIGSLRKGKKGIALTCRRVSVKTGQVIQSAEIRGISFNDLEANIEQAAKMILMTDEQKRKYLSDIQKYTHYLKEAASAQKAGRFDDVVKYYRKAIKFKKTAGIVAKLTRAEEQAENARIAAEKQAEIQRKVDTAKAAYVKTAAGPDIKPVADKAWTVPGLKMSFVYVRPGSFVMGDKNNKDGNTEHEVKLSSGYWLGKCEVSQMEYMLVMGTNPSLFKGFNLPVDNVCWNECMAFCEKLNERERAAKRLPKGYEYRLPTEAEWEFAARGGLNSKGYKYIGGNDAVKVGWNDKNSGGKTHPVGTREPNELGLYNMAGNLIEACYDQYASWDNIPSVDPVTINSSARIVRRGGFWRMSEAGANVTYRYYNRRARKRNWFGFRVALAKQISLIAPKPEPRKSWVVPDIGIKMVYVTPGSFSMGSGSGRMCKPAHKVTLTKGYWIGKFEITQGEYQLLTGTNPSCFKGEKNPVEMVSWKEAVMFCRKLTKRERNSGRLPDGYEYRLPTEAEWEFAATGGSLSRRRYKYSGGDRLDQVAWYKNNAKESTHKVGNKWGNELSLFDMTGNVYEMCYDSKYQYTTKAQVDPCFYSGGRLFIVRGGGWRNSEKDSSLYSRFGANRKKRHSDRGFRIVMAPKI